MRRRIKPIMGVLFALMLAGCAQAPSPTTERAEPPSPPEDPYQAQRKEALDQALVAAESGEGLVFRGPTEYVYLFDFQFDPATIRLKSGTITRVRLHNIAWVTHYFGGEAFFERGAEIVNMLGTELPDLHHIPVPPLSSRDLYLFIKEPGEYPLSCFVPTHRTQGMTGTLVVEP